MRDYFKLPYKDWTQEERDADDLRIKRQQMEAEEDHFLEYTNIPRLHWKNLQPKTDQRWLQSFEKLRTTLTTKSNAIIAMIGPRGTGKTQAAVEITRLRQRPDLVKYLRAMEIFLLIKATFSSKRDTQERALEKLSAAPLLIIDEIQVRGETQWENDILTTIIDERYASLRPTILIGNLTHEALAKNVGESIYSRLTETGGIIKFDGPSFRTMEGG